MRIRNLVAVGFVAAVGLLVGPALVATEEKSVPASPETAPVLAMEQFPEQIFTPDISKVGGTPELSGLPAARLICWADVDYCAKEGAYCGHTLLGDPCYCHRCCDSKNGQWQCVTPPFIP